MSLPLLRNDLGEELDSFFQDINDSDYFLTPPSSPPATPRHPMTSIYPKTYTRPAAFLFLSSFLENPFSTLLTLLFTTALRILVHPFVHQLRHFVFIGAQILLLCVSFYTLPRTLCKFVSFTHIYFRKNYPLQPWHVIVKDLFRVSLMRTLHKVPYCKSLFPNPTDLTSNPSSLTAPTSPKASFSSLPYELKTLILLHATPETIFHFGYTSRANYAMATSPSLWQRKLRLDYPTTTPATGATPPLTSVLAQYRMYRDAVYFDCSCTLCKHSDMKKAPWAFFFLHDPTTCGCLGHVSGCGDAWWVPYYHHYMCGFKEYDRGALFVLGQEAKVAWYHLHHVLLTPSKLLALLWLPMIGCCALRLRQRHVFHSVFGVYARELYHICVSWCSVWNIHWLMCLAPSLVLFLATSECLALLRAISSSRPFRFLHTRTFSTLFWLSSLLGLFLVTWLCQKELWHRGRTWSDIMVSNLFSW